MENPKQTWIRNGGSPMKVEAQKFTEDNGNLQLPNDVFFFFRIFHGHVTVTNHYLEQNGSIY